MRKGLVDGRNIERVVCLYLEGRHIEVLAGYKWVRAICSQSDVWPRPSAACVPSPLVGRYLCHGSVGTIILYPSRSDCP